jgi:hypothetical protein
MGSKYSHMPWQCSHSSKNFSMVLSYEKISILHESLQKGMDTNKIIVKNKLKNTLSSHVLILSSNGLMNAAPFIAEVFTI